MLTNMSHMMNKTFREQIADLIREEIEASLKDALSGLTVTAPEFTADQVKAIGDIAEQRLTQDLTNGVGEPTKINADGSVRRKPGRRRGTTLSDTPSAINQRRYREIRRAKAEGRPIPEFDAMGNVITSPEIGVQLIKSPSMAQLTDALQQMRPAIVSSADYKSEQDRLWAEYESTPLPGQDFDVAESLGRVVSDTVAEALKPNAPPASMPIVTAPLAQPAPTPSNMDDDPFDGMIF